MRRVAVPVAWLRPVRRGQCHRRTLRQYSYSNPRAHAREDAMIRTVDGFVRVLSAVGLCALASGVAHGQAPAPGTGEPMVLDAVAFTSFVENMDRSLGFYHDVFG